MEKIERETLGFIPSSVYEGDSGRMWIPSRGDRVISPNSEVQYLTRPSRPFKLTELWFHNVHDSITVEHLNVGDVCVIDGPLPAKHYDIAWILKLKDDNGLKDETIKRVLDRLHVSCPVAYPGTVIRLHVKNHDSVAHRVDVSATGFAGDMNPQTLNGIFGKMGKPNFHVRKIQTSSKYGFVGGRIEEPIKELDEDEDEGAWSTPTWDEP